MRTFIVAVIISLFASVASAGQITVSVVVDDAAIAPELSKHNAQVDQYNARIAAKPGPPLSPDKPPALPHVTAQQLVQGWVDARVKASAQAEENRAFAQLQRECRTGSPVACAKIKAATKE